MTKRFAILCCLTGLFFFHFPPVVFAQTNSWTNSASGKWEDLNWSAGVLPGTNQTTIVFTNEGLKTLTIDSNTVQNFPETLTVGFVTISAPANSFNTLVLSNAELTALGGFTLSSNSAVELYSSFLHPQQFFVDGNFTENHSQIAVGSGGGDSFYLGMNGPGVFNMTNSLLGCFDEYLGGSFPATFNQQGGTNSTQLVFLEDSSEYNFFDGDLGFATNEITILFQGEAEFNQFGGSVSASLAYLRGICRYHLAGGNFSCSNLDIPYNQEGPYCDGYFWQSGGTNVTGQIVLGSDRGPGAYSLSGGVLVSAGLILQDHFFGFNPGEEPFASFFFQSGGFHTNGGVQISGAADEDYYINPSIYELSNGILETPSITLNMGVFDQSDGTNVANTIALNNLSTYSLNAGWLIAQNLEVNGDGAPYPFGGPGGKLTTFQQPGGTNLISGTLSLTLDSSYEMHDGELVAQKISLSDSAFYHDGGTVNVRSVLELSNGNWYEQASGGELGQLQITGSTDSVSFSNRFCILRFDDSSGVLWSNSAVLVLSNWSGSLYGGGNQRVIFGSNSTALTLQQLSQIQFQNPAGLPPGNYPARILATGEIVPDTGAPLPMKVTLTLCPTNPAMQLILCGDIGRTYSIEVSPDLVHWNTWTDQFNASGTMLLDDNGSTNCPQRFYRARLMP